jgi:hypothetical protein
VESLFAERNFTMKPMGMYRLFTLIIIGTMIVIMAQALSAQAVDGPVNQTINTIWQFNLGGDKKQTETFTASIAIKGLWGPIPQDEPGVRYLLKVYNPDKDDGMISPVPGNYVVLSGWQRQGGPVTVQVHCPSVEQLGILRAKTPNTRYFFRPTKRFVNFRIVRRDEFNQSDFEQKIQLKVDHQKGSATWIPARHLDRNGRVRSMAPVVIEVSVTYQGMYGLEVDGNPKAGWEKKTHVKRKVGWLVLPICGNTYGDHMASCPAGAGAIANWKSRTLGELSLAVPDNWRQRLSPDKTQGSWDYDSANPPSASLLLIRENPDKLFTHMKISQEKKLSLNGMAAKMYHGRVEVKKSESRVYVLDEKDAKGRPVVLAAISSDWRRYGPLLEACMNSLQKGDTAKTPDASPDPPGPQGGPLEYTAQAVDTKPQGNQNKVVIIKGQPGKGKKKQDQQGLGRSSQAAKGGRQESKPLEVHLMRKRGFADFTGRGEKPGANGSADVRLVMHVDAPGETITSVSISTMADQKVVWDTTPGNQTWLLVMTHKNKVLNQKDGNLRHTLPKGRQKYDVWVQDNNSIAAEKARFKLTVVLESGRKLECEVSDPAISK